MATLQDIADKLNITKGTVSKALNGANDVSAELQKTVIETALSLGYTKFLRHRDTKKICILVNNMEYQNSYEFGYDIILGFKQLAQPAGYSIDVIEADKELQQSEKFDVYMMKNHFVGAFVLGFSLEDPWLESLKTCKTPTVVYDNYIYGNPNVAKVSVDNREGMYLAISHLKDLGHSHIGYLSGDLGAHVMQVRMRAFFQAMEMFGLEAGEDMAFSEYEITKNVDLHLPTLLDMGVSAIVCSHDLLAYAVIQKCKQLSLKIPQDISIIGFDDLPICAHTSPPITTLRQDRIQLGKTAFNALSSLLDHVHLSVVSLHAELIVRASTAKAKKRTKRTE